MYCRVVAAVAGGCGAGVSETLASIRLSTSSLNQCDSLRPADDLRGRVVRIRRTARWWECSRVQGEALRKFLVGSLERVWLTLGR